MGTTYQANVSLPFRRICKACSADDVGTYDSFIKDVNRGYSFQAAKTLKGPVHPFGFLWQEPDKNPFSPQLPADVRRLTACPGCRDPGSQGNRLGG
jgi:hypothetical protein